MRLLRAKELTEKIGVKRSVIYGLMRKNQFPLPRKIGSRTVAWVEDEVNDWLMKLKKVKLKTTIDNDDLI